MNVKRRRGEGELGLGTGKVPTDFSDILRIKQLLGGKSWRSNPTEESPKVKRVDLNQLQVNYNALQ